MVNMDVNESSGQNSGDFPGHAIYRSSWIVDRKGEDDTGTNGSHQSIQSIVKTNGSQQNGSNKTPRTVKDIVRNFALKTTSHGVARVAEAGNGVTRCLWLAVVFMAFIAFSIQMVLLILLYFDYPVSVKLGVVSNNSLIFPAVTICNNNKIRKSAISESVYKELLTIDDSSARTGYLTYIGPCIPDDVACDVNETQCVKSYMKCNGINDCPNGGDELDCNYGNCYDFEFHCPSGKCIPDHLVCDYKNDCGDWSDEQDCSFPSCGDLQFTCDNHQCIPDSLVCDGKLDCYDGSDETIGDVVCVFPKSVCPKNYFRCRNGECVHYVNRCDGQLYCSDGTDERDCLYNDDMCPDQFFQCRILSQCVPAAAVCDTKYQCQDRTDEKFCTYQYPNGCTYEASFPCNDGTCIDIDGRCDGYMQCPGGVDEYGCNSSSSCPNGYFTCTSGRCIEAIHVCDGQLDCISPSGLGNDRSDEENCVNFNCSDSRFQCSNGICLHMSKRCDGLDHCLEDDDEQGCDQNSCGDDFFRCNNGRCIDMERRCDGVYDCQGDEENCLHSVCPANYFTCHDGQCISAVNRCNFRRDCKDGSDEINCSTVQCSDGYFRCESGQCVPKGLHCNRQVDCVDGMDEFNCTGSEPPPVTCSSAEFKCISVETCVNISFVCNGVDDCGDNSDESECSFEVVCSADEFKCENNEGEDDYCIPLSWLCDRINQCADGADERNCIYDIEDVFSNMDWKTPYLDITDDTHIFDEFIRLVYVARNFDFVPSEDPPSWNQFLFASSTPDFTDLQDVLKLSPENLAILGHQAEDFILQCTYDQKKCNYSEFLVFQHDKYGNCFTFNYQLENTSNKVRRATTAGADYGLKLTLFLEQDEYIGLFGQQSGVRVTIHHPTVKPFPEDEGVYVSPGAVTAISIKLNKRTRMGLPHGNCTDQKLSDDNIYEYSSLACQKMCLQKYLYSKCDCVDTLTDDKPRCSVLNKTQDVCKQLIHYFYQSSLLTCDCQQPCSQSTYSKTVSQSLWPSLASLPHLLNSIHATNRKTWVIRDKDTAREDLVRLEVYYEDLNFNLVSEEAAYPIYQLLSDTGGSLGLWIGLSFITVIEFIEFLVFLCQAARKRSHEHIRRYSTRRKTQRT